MYGYPPKIDLLSGKPYDSSLSRAFVEFILDELNLTEFTRRMELTEYGADEALLNTLNAVDAIDAPGGFTQQCQRNGIGHGHITRYSFTITIFA